MDTKKMRKIVLKDGSEYIGFGFGDNSQRVCELVFNTAMVGYQEIISDPSNIYKAVIMTYPLIGNYGIADDDFESRIPMTGALIVREYNDIPSNFRSTKTLSEVMEEYHIPGIYGIDTRKLTRVIRDSGSQPALITDADTPIDKALEILNAPAEWQDAVSRVSCKKRWYSRTANAKYNVVVVDLGVKLNLIRSLNARGCNVTVVPFDSTAQEIEKMRPDGVFFSNGPGNPQDVFEVTQLIKNLRGKYPMCGIDLGYQLICLAYGARLERLKCHRASCYPVKNLMDGKIAAAPVNHGYIVDKQSLEATELTLTHISVLDESAMGVKCDSDKVFCVQYHPESAPGPQDSGQLFDRFIEMMKGEE